MANRNMKRLIKQSIDYSIQTKVKRLIKANNIYDSVFRNLGKDGREVLKTIEDYKYKVIQSLNIVSNDETLSGKVEKYIEDLNNVSAFFYSFVFDMENYDIVDDYDKQIEFTVPKEEIEDTVENEEDKGNNENKEDINNGSTDDEEDNKNSENEEDDIDNDEIEEDSEEVTEEDNSEETDSKDEDVDIDALFEQAKENDENLE